MAETKAAQLIANAKQQSSTGAQMEPMIDLAAWLSAWRRTWRLLGVEASVPELTAVLNAWGESHRRYHDLTHLRECLDRWDEWQHLAEQPGEVALALWYHDAIYNPRSTDNELRSAAWAARAMTEAGVDVGAVQRVHDLVMATAHNGPAVTREAELVVDIDLATLGAAPERFEAYDQAVRKEYARVPGFLYRRKRREVLQSFLARPRIYATDAAFLDLEAPARRNLVAFGPVAMADDLLAPHSLGLFEADVAPKQPTAELSLATRPQASNGPLRLHAGGRAGHRGEGQLGSVFAGRRGEQ